MKTLKAFLIIVAGVFCATGSFAAANLKGTYSFVGHDSCTLAGSGVSGSNGAVGTINGTAQGFATFNGDGTGTITVNYDWVVVTTNAPPAISTFAPGNIAFTYTVTGDEFTITE